MDGQGVQKGPSSKAGGSLAGGAYEGVREHDKGPRTPLADFFNTLLDFDDAYQYAAAEKHTLTLVSFDADFDRTDRGRKTPQEVLTIG